MTGTMSHHGGHAAEEQVERHYLGRGAVPAARNWRGSRGEIDLILREGARVVFVEVKRAESFATAAERLGPAQIARILGAASEFLAGEPSGQDTEVRFDLALVDGQGRIEIIPNAFGA
ncbi:YraN family protein [Frigidibacter sp. RF13]|uniref:YraN family protein n=1 Tax=Frigidibacter sp. RF13 TaxID=2997340 RepID=UPI00226F49DA|nr:YraN family protein [Frigidibacter sp. RF13]MCY1126177.1 YraN family protein [Frigidibacter sp. RF13]